MCFPYDAIVPDLPAGFRVMAGGAAGEHLTLTSADGTEFSAYLARAEGATGVVVLPDVRGLFRFYEQLAERFEYMPHVLQTTPETVAKDVEAALLKLMEETGVERAITVGFCFGGA